MTIRVKAFDVQDSEDLLSLEGSAQMTVAEWNDPVAHAMASRVLDLIAEVRQLRARGFAPAKSYRDRAERAETIVIHARELLRRELHPNGVHRGACIDFGRALLEVLAQPAAQNTGKSSR